MRIRKLSEFRKRSINAILKNFNYRGKFEGNDLNDGEKSKANSSRGRYIDEIRIEKEGNRKERERERERAEGKIDRKALMKMACTSVDLKRYR